MNNEDKILAILANLQADMAGMKADMSGMKADMTEMKADLQDVKTRVIIIENDHGQSLKALHDGHKLLYDAVVEVRTDVRKAFDKIERSETNIMALEFDKHKSKNLGG